MISLVLWSLAIPCSLNLESADMKIYAAGWALQSPALNYFKKFLLANGISLSGIIYPKRIPDDLDGIAILDFESARHVLTADDTILQCLRPGVADLRLGTEFNAFFGALGLQTISVSDFVISLVEQDQYNRLRFPVEGIVSQDIQALRSEPLLSFLDDGFADLESYQTACSLDAAAKAADWDQLLAYDRDNTPGQVLYELIADLQARNVCRHFHVLDAPQLFLNALLKFKALNPMADLSIELSPAVVVELGPRLEFYRRTLACTEELAGSEGVTYLAGSTDTITAHLQQHPASASAIFFMQRSIVDYRRFRRAQRSSRHRILLRQPDTVPGHLIAVYLT